MVCSQKKSLWHACEWCVCAAQGLEGHQRDAGFDLTENGCKPLRPAYAADLRTATLEASARPHDREALAKIRPFQLDFVPTSTKPLEYYPSSAFAPSTDVGPATFSLMRPGGGNSSVNGSAALSAGGRRRRSLAERMTAHSPWNVRRARRGAGRSLTQLALDGVPLVERNRSTGTVPGTVLGGMEHAMWGCSINHTPEQFPDRAPIVLPMGTIQEWNVTNLMLHSLHLHVNPFQIVDLVDSANLTNYWMVRPPLRGACKRAGPALGSLHACAAKGGHQPCIQLSMISNSAMVLRLAAARARSRGTTRTCCCCRRAQGARRCASSRARTRATRSCTATSCSTRTRAAPRSCATPAQAPRAPPPPRPSPTSAPTSRGPCTAPCTTPPAPSTPSERTRAPPPAPCGGKRWEWQIILAHAIYWRNGVSAVAHS